MTYPLQPTAPPAGPVWALSGATRLRVVLAPGGGQAIRIRPAR